jgi:aurora kinase
VRDFVLVKEIGTGNASTVWYAFCKKTSAPLAIKTYKKRKLSPLNRCQVAREINIHSQLDHPNVIALVRQHVLVRRTVHDFDVKPV